MKNQTIIFGICSGIAAYKMVGVVRAFAKQGFKTIVVMTDHAQQMISVKEFEKASGHPVAHELFPKGFDYKKIIASKRVKHISLADRANLICIAPATANIVAKLANGIADDLLTTTVLATQAPILVCPSMNVHMWQNSVTQKNVRALIDRGFHVLEPATGRLACGHTGKGRLPDPKVIEKDMRKILTKGQSLSGKRIVVTAGGTEEPIDDVRVITNRSSGKMGIAIAEECCRRGAHVTLIRARTSVEPLCQLHDIKVSTVKEMQQALRRHVKKCHAVIHAAAVSDYCVAKSFSGKLSSQKEEREIRLVRAPKLINAIKTKKHKPVLVGFKAVSHQSLQEMMRAAKELITQSKADFVVANDVGRAQVFGADENEVTLIFAHGKKKLIPRTSKRNIAEKIVHHLSHLI